MKAAVSDTGEPAAANDVVHVAVPLDPPALTGWFVQPAIGAPAAEKATAPDGATSAFVVTVAVSVTGWLVLAGDGFGGASVVVVCVVPVTTVAVDAVGGVADLHLGAGTEAIQRQGRRPPAHW